MPDQVELKVNVLTQGGDKLDELVRSVQAIESAVTKASPSLDDIQKRIKQAGDQASESADGFQKFAEGVKNFIQDPLHAAGEMVETFLNKLGPAGTAISGVVAGFGAFYEAAASNIKSLGEMATRIDDVRARTGFTTEEVGKFTFAAKLSGTTVESFEMGMRMLSQAMDDNSEVGERSREALQGMGIASRDMLGHLVPASQMFAQISEALTHMGAATERVAFVTNIFGRAGTELLPVLMDLKHNLEVAGLAQDDFMSEMETEKAKRHAEGLALIESRIDAIGRKFKELVGDAGAFYFLLDSHKDEARLNRNRPGGTVSHQVILPNGQPVPDWTDNPQGALLGFMPTFDANLAIRAGAGRVLGQNPQQHLDAANADLTRAQQVLNTIRTTGRISEDAKTDPKADLAKATEVYTKATSEVTKWQGAVDAAKASQEALNKQVELLADLANKGANPMEQLFNQVEQTFNITGLSPAARQKRIQGVEQSPEFLDAMNRLFQEQRDEMSDVQDKEAQDQVMRDIAGGRAGLKPMEEQYEQLHRFDEGVVAQGKRDYGANRSIDEIQAASTREDLVRQAGRAQQINQLQIPLGSGAAGQQQAANDAYKIRLGLAQQIRDVDLDLASKLTDAAKGRVEAQKAAADYAKESKEAELELEMKLLALDKERQEEARSLTTGIFDAFTAKDPGAAMRTFFINQAKGVGSSVFSNIMQPVFEPLAGTIDTLKSAGSGWSGSTTNGQVGRGLGGLLGGGIPGAITPDNTARKANTDAVLMQTKATLDLTQALTYIATGGTSGGLAGGSVAPSITGGGVPGSGVSGLSLGTLASYNSGLTPSLASLMSPAVLGSTSFGSDVPASTYDFSDLGGAVLGGGNPTDDLSNMPLGRGAPVTASVQMASSADSITSAVKTFSAGLAKIGGPSSAFGSGAATVASGHAIGTIMGSYSPNADGTDTTVQQIGAGIGLAGATYAGVSSALHDFSKGGGQGIAQGIGAIAGTAAMFDPEPISHAVLQGVALVSTMVGAIFGDPKAERTAQINHELQNNAYNSTGYIDSRGNYVPGAQARSISYFGASGGQSYDTNFQGGIRGGSFASTTRNMFDPSAAANQLRSGYYSPPAGTPIDAGIGYGDQAGNGTIQRPVTRGGAVVAPAPMVIQVQTMDSKSFMDHASDISDAVRKGIQMGHPVVQEMQQAINPR